MFKRLSFLISFAVLIIAASSVQARTTVTTTMGNGADAYVSNHNGGSGPWRPSTTHGTEGKIQVRYLPDTRLMIGYLRFDIGEVTGDMTGATLSMTTVQLKDGTKTINVYGLTDETLDSWDESTICYDNAPGMLPPTPAYGNYTIDDTKLTLLGTIMSPAAPGNVTGTYYIVFTSDPSILFLDSFISADTNKLLTLVLIAQGDSEHEYATKENTNQDLLRPTLTFPNAFRPPATYPNPANGRMIYTTNVSLQWQRGAYAAQHDIYLADDFNDVNNANNLEPMGPDKVYKARQSVDANNYKAAGLISGTTYYWRIDEVRADGTTIDRGEVWKFSIVSVLAWDPTPTNNFMYVAPKMTLRWHGGTWAVDGYNVYLSDSFDQVNNAPEGSENPPFRAFLEMTADPNWNPAQSGIPLEFNKTYYWRIDELDGIEVCKGNVWRFKTVPNAPPEPNLIGWWKFDGDASDSGYGCDGTEIGGPTYDVVNLDSAIFINNSNNTNPVDDIYVDLPIGSVISTLKSSTFAVWVNWMGTEGDRRWQRFFSFGTDIGNFMVLSPRRSADVPTYFEITTGGFTQRVSWGTYPNFGNMITGNEWLHLAVTISNPNEAGTRTFTLYIDGDPCGVNTAATFTPSNLGFTTQNWLGRTENITEQQPYRGYLDDFRIYDRELSQAEIQSILTPQKAWRPRPSNHAINVQSNPTLSWTSGKFADKHDIYLGTDFNDVNSANTSTAEIYKGQQSENTFNTGILEFNTNYYWRIDEVNTVELNFWRGTVWSFTTGAYITVDDFESYNDLDPTDLNSSRIYNTWLDYYANNSGATVGYLWETLPEDEHFAETTIVNSGAQSMPLFYDNDGTVNEGTKFERTGTYYYSETERTFDPVQDWTTHNIKSLVLWFRGYPATVGSYTYSPANNGTFTLRADGADIWGITDEFHFVYKELIGDADIIAKVVDVQNTNEWAKAGVMIRDSLDADSTNAFVFVTPSSSGRMAFQARTEYKDATLQSASDVNAISLPHWIRLVRQFGNVFYAYHSTDGTNWEKLPVYTDATAANPQNVTMSDPAYIGLAYTSHVSGTLGQAVFSNVKINDVPFQSTGSRDIPSNDAEQLYIAVEDSSSNIKVIPHTNPDAVQFDTWTEWPIDLAQIEGAGVDTKNIKKMYIGIGNRDNPVSGGFGKLYIDDIRLYPSRCVLSMRSSDFAKIDYAPAGNPAGDCVVNYRELELMADDWLFGTVPSTADEIWLEAESANTMSPPMQVWLDRSDAIGGRYIAVEPGNNSSDNPPTEGVATYVFAVKGGTYKILVRVIAPSGTDDSFWFNIPGATTQTTNHSSGWVKMDVAEGSTWHWDEVNSDDDGDQTVQFTMGAGTYTLSVAYREDGTLLDRLLITDDLTLNQANLPPQVDDVNIDDRVDLEDFAIVAEQWLNEQLWP